MRKLWTCLLAVLLCLSMLTGMALADGEGLKLDIVYLGSNDTAIEAANTKEGGPTPADLYSITNREKMEAAYPETTFEFMDWGWSEALDQKQRVAIAGGTPPTNIAGETFIPAYAYNGMLQEVPDWVLEGLNESFIYRGEDGKAYAVAFQTSTFLLYYNKAVLREAGLDPETPPTTWTEWAEMSKKITEAGAGAYWGGGIPSFPHAGGALRATPFFRQLGTDFGGGDDINLDDPLLQEVLAYIREMNAFFPAGLANNPDEGPLWNAFEKEGEQNLAFAVNGAWQESACIRNNVDFGVAPLPIADGGKVGNCLVGTVYIGVPTDVGEAEAKLFWEIFKNICLSEEQLLYVIGDGRVVPVQDVLDKDELWAGNQSLQLIKKDLEAGEPFQPLAAFVKNDGQIWEIINQQVLARTTMTNDPIEDICAQAQTQIEALLK